MRNIEIMNHHYLQYSLIQILIILISINRDIQIFIYIINIIYIIPEKFLDINKSYLSFLPKIPPNDPFKIIEINKSYLSILPKI